MTLTKYARKVLKEVVTAAGNGEIITYGELAKRLGQEGKTLCLPNVLGKISEHSYQELGVFLTAIIVNKETKRPGPGFRHMISHEMENTDLVSESFISAHIKTIHNLSERSLDNLISTSY